MSKTAQLLVFLSIAFLAVPAGAFNGHQVTEGPLQLFIGEIATVTNSNRPQAVAVSLTNTADAPLTVALTLRGLVDDCRAVGPVQRRIDLAPKGHGTATFQFQCGSGCVSAHYPVHVLASFEYGGKPLTAHAIRIFECDFGPAATGSPTTETLPLLTVPKAGGFALTAPKDCRVAWNYYDQPVARLPVGWQGREDQSYAHFSYGSVDRGESRPALHMHPPYRPGGGSIFAEYRLKLPKVQPLKLAFYNAIRDHGPTEPPSDGVTFRVWANTEKLFERHTDAKTWLPGEADLGRFAGQEILLRLEAHPGPKRNTVCDSCYWGDPTIVAGAPPRLLSALEKTQLQDRVRRGLGGGAVSGEDLFRFNLADGGVAVVGLGPSGLADGIIGFGAADDKIALFDGLDISVRDQRVGSWPSGIVVRKVATSGPDAGHVTVAHHLEMNEQSFVLVAELWAEGPGLRIKITCPEPISDLALGKADRLATRVYYGHGYGIDHPQAFRAGGGGHNLATSHVGFDFEGGLSLLTACDTPPDHLLVNPERRLYQLHTHPDSILTFVPGRRGAFDCALRYRPLYDKRAAAGFTRKAGRFVFDLWGGRHADNTALLRRCFNYGLTNSLVIMHVWQRWGYDYRLPDIYPPDPKLGTLEELRELGQVCAQAGALWGLHDNYIDFYPDADDYSYDHIVFTADGRPMRAWLNEGRDAQSYRWRPDRFLPFLKRNMERIVPNLRPTASFVDVFTSINSFDFYDRQGNFHSKLETRQAWGDSFAYIRDVCGNHAPTTSEAGSDHLVGWLDGADCQFLELSPRGRRFYNVAPCADWERVPWFDAVNHTRFSLHGVGYSGRYQGDRSRHQHGIESDDYLSAEILTAHALMIDRPGMIHGAVRKYWLAQDLIESLAFDDLAAVEYTGGDIHRQIVTWKSGARVLVNRGRSNWNVDGHVLPPYGYHARNGGIESAVELIDGNVVERSRGKNGFYVNGRGFNSDAALRITPVADKVEYLGGRNFRFVVNWEAAGSAPMDLTVFYHFTRPQPGRRTEYVFYGGGAPPAPTSQWRGRVVTGDKWTIGIPEDMPVGEYEITVGLYDAKGRGGKRYRLQGDEDGERRIRVGRLVVEGKTNVVNISLKKPERPAPSLPPETNLVPTDFGVARTLGAFRCEQRADEIRLVPLPADADFEVVLRPERILGRRLPVKAVEVLDAAGTKLRDHRFEQNGDEISFRVVRNDFAYRVLFR